MFTPPSLNDLQDISLERLADRNIQLGDARKRTTQVYYGLLTLALAPPQMSVWAGKAANLVID